MLAKQAEKAYFFRVFDRESNHLKIRLQRDKGSFVSLFAMHMPQHFGKRKHGQCVCRLKNGGADIWQNNGHKGINITSTATKHLLLKVEKYLSINIDGMDKKKTNVPVMATNIKDESPWCNELLE